MRNVNTDKALKNLVISDSLIEMNQFTPKTVFCDKNFKMIGMLGDNEDKGF